MMRHYAPAILGVSTRVVSVMYCGCAVTRSASVSTNDEHAHPEPYLGGQSKRIGGRDAAMLGALTFLY